MSKRTLIISVFHQYNENIQFFIENGLFQSEDKTFLLVLNGLMTDREHCDFLELYSNVHVLIRPNEGYDFAGVNSALFTPFSMLSKRIFNEKDFSKEDEDYLYLHFDQFVVLNASVKGPYLPLYVQENWVDLFTSPLSEEVKLSGISANLLASSPNDMITFHLSRKYPEYHFPDRVHIQSMAYCFDRESLDLFFKYDIFSKGKQYPSDKDELIACYEVGMSLILRLEKKNLFSLDISQGEIDWNSTEYDGDIWWSREDHPILETIFVKTNTPKSQFPEKIRYDHSPYYKIE